MSIKISYTYITGRRELAITEFGPTSNFMVEVGDPELNKEDVTLPLSAMRDLYNLLHRRFENQ